MKKDTEISNETRAFNVEVKFAMEYEPDESGNQTVTLRQIVRCGETVIEKEFSQLEDSLAVGFIEIARRRQAFESMEKKLAEAAQELIIEATRNIGEQTTGEKSGYSLMDKIFYPFLKEKNHLRWKKAYKTFKDLKHLPIEKRIEAVKIAHQDLPENLIEKFASKDSYDRSPANLARLHTVEIMKMPAHAEDYRRKLIEGKEADNSMQFFLQTMIEPLNNQNEQNTPNKS